MQIVTLTDEYCFFKLFPAACRGVARRAKTGAGFYFPAFLCVALRALRLDSFFLEICVNLCNLWIICSTNIMDPFHFYNFDRNSNSLAWVFLVPMARISTCFSFDFLKYRRPL